MAGLSLVATAVQLEFQRFVKECGKEATEMFSKSIVVPMGFSPVSSVNQGFATTVKELEPGRNLLAEVKSKLNLDLPANCFVFSIHWKMICVRSGEVGEEKRAGWEASAGRCRICVRQRPKIHGGRRPRNTLAVH